jgi:hypothetical protein
MNTIKENKKVMKGENTKEIINHQISMGYSISKINVTDDGMLKAVLCFFTLQALHRCKNMS